MENLKTLFVMAVHTIGIFSFIAVGIYTMFTVFPNTVDIYKHASWNHGVAFCVGGQGNKEERVSDSLYSIYKDNVQMMISIDHQNDKEVSELLTEALYKCKK
jgi:hypothetical protein